MNKPLLANDLIKQFELWAPKKLAYDWDNVGLQVGSLNKKISKVMVTLDVLENVVDEAINENVDLIIAHHPMLFKPPKNINVDQPSGRIIQKLLKHDITVYAAHTNLDIASGGVNDMLADKLELENTEVMVETGREELLKLAVFVPEDYKDSLIEALGQSGAGYIGNYSHCSFHSKGIGSFKPEDGTTPFIGELGKIEKVNEIKIETIVKQSQLAHVLPAMIAAHPYEEVAYDLIPLKNKGEQHGLGKIGQVKEEMTLAEFCEHVKAKLDIPTLRVTGNLQKKVKKAAVVGGSGKGFIGIAKSRGADVYITGDMTFHEAQDAWQMGLNVVDSGHYAEKVMKQAVKEYLDTKLNELQSTVEVIVSKENTDPFQYV